MTEPELITIGDDRSQCVLCPDLGGSVISWEVDGQPMLRTVECDAIASSDPLMLASFPLVPYSNRIGHAQYNWRGQTICITPNFAPEPHAIHGVGWTRPWLVEAVQAHRCTLRIEHEADEHWPFAFSASQSFELADGALKITSAAVNRADQPAPLAIGHHPYFDQQGASLRFNAGVVLLNGEDALPLDATIPHGQFDFSEDGAVAGRDVDHCYADWDGYAEIRWKARRLAVEIRSDMKAAVVYIPKDGTAFCFEPVPHVNNALNRTDLAPAMPIVQPGAAFASTITLQTVAWRDIEPKPALNCHHALGGASDSRCTKV
jgi:aldose 1-epimerase